MSTPTLVHELKWRFFQDDANGEWGIANEPTIGYQNGSDGFNAFWDGRGLFHEAFEHWFEHKHPHFLGEAAMNIGGEMAAMGALWYYFDELGVHSRQQPGNIHWFGDSMRRTTEDMVTEVLNEGYCQFGQVLVSEVPKQRPTDNSELECQLDLYWNNVKGHKVDKWGHARDDKRAKEMAAIYRKSLSKRKIQDLHRWGYRMASELVPNHYENRETLSEFITFWDKFCKNNRAEEIAQVCNYLTIKLFRDEDERVTWKAYLTGQPGTGIHELEVTEHFSVEDLYQMELT